MSTTLRKKASLIGSIEQLLAEVAASEKRAEANTEAGGYMGATTHPVADADDRTDDAVEGARSAENTSDVKDEPNRGQTVDATEPGPGAGQESVQLNIGITSKATGEDSGAETDSAKAGKQDGGTFQGSTTHPARTDNDALDGHKYASLRQLCKQAEQIGSALCAAIAANSDAATAKRATDIALNSAGDSEASGQEDSKAGGVTGKDGAPITSDKEPSKVEARDESGSNCAKESAHAGYDLAGVFANMDVSTEDKQAADALVVDTIGEILLMADRRAQKCAEFYAAHFDPRNQKLAEGEELPPEAAGAEGGDPMAEGVEGELGGGGEEIDPETAQLLMQLLSQGEGMGAEDALQGMAGGDAGGELPPDVGGGGDLGGELGGESPEDMQMLEQIMGELGVSPEDVEQGVADKQAAARKTAAAKRQTRWVPKTAADRAKFAHMRQVIQELTGRSRR